MVKKLFKKELKFEIENNNEIENLVQKINLKDEMGQYKIRKSHLLQQKLMLQDLIFTESNNHLYYNNKLFDKYLSDDEPNLLIPQRITKYDIKNILNKGFDKNHSKFKTDFKENLNNKKDFTKKSSSKIFSQTSSILENIEKKEITNLNKDELTIDRIAYDINKQHISFNRRRTEEFINRKSIKKFKIFGNDPIKQNPPEIAKNMFTVVIENTLKNKIHYRINKTKNNWRRVRICVIVIESLIFLQKEITLFGIKSTQSDIKFLYCNNPINDEINSFQMSCLRDNNLSPLVEKPLYIIMPGSKFHSIWRIVLFITLLVFVIMYPFRIGFYNQGYMVISNMLFYADFILESIFLFDFIINCLTAFYDEEGNLEFNVNNILKNYLIEYFIVDLLCLFPIDLFFQNNDSERYLILKLIKFLRIFKFGRIINSLNFVNQFQDYVYLHAGIIKLIYFFINSIILCFTFACLWHFSAIVNDSDKTWVYCQNFQDDSKWDLFLKSIYFGYTVFITVGYGDIVPRTTVEIILVCIWMYICALYFTFTLTSLSNIFLESNASNLRTNNKCLMIEEIFRTSKLDHLIQKTTFHLKRNENQTQNYSYSLKDLRNLLLELPTSIKVEIARTMYNNSIEKIMVFREFNSRYFMANILPLLQSNLVLKDNSIYSVDELPDKIYFLVSGSVYFTNDDFIVFQNLNQGSYFGEIEILRKTYRESNTRARENCQLLTLTKKIICNDIVNNYYKIFQVLLRNMVKRWNFFVKLMNLIDDIIEEGRKIYDNDLANLVKNKLNLVFEKQIYNKFYFGIGILNRLEQLKKTNDNNNPYNLDAIKDVFPRNEIINENLIKKSSFKIKNIKKLVHINELKDNEEINFFEKMDLNKTKTILNDQTDQQINLKENKEMLNEMKTFYKKLDKFLDKKRKNIVYNMGVKKEHSEKIESRNSIFKKSKTVNIKGEKMKPDKIDDSFYKKLKTLNFT